MKRSVYWREELKDDFMVKEFRKAYFLGLIEEEGLSVIHALKRSVKAMGIKEFAKLVKMPPSNVSRALSSEDFKLSTLIRFLAVFELDISVAEKHSA